MKATHSNDLACVVFAQTERKITMFKIPKLKTPHLSPRRHAVMMVVIFMSMTLLATMAGLVQSSSFLSAIAVIVASGVTSVFLGTLLTASTRAYFGLIQTGRFIQYLGFWLATSLSVGLSSYMFTDGATFASSLFGGLVIFSCSFATAYLLGEIPWRGRTWLPMKRKQ
jgi:hypothetical protein